jgi:hypothetical protein
VCDNRNGSRARVKSTRWHSAFLKALRRNPNVALAARAAGVNRTTVYRHKTDDESFALRFEEVLDAAVDKVEATCFQLAGKGDARLIEFILKSHRPAVYRERAEVAVAGGIIFLPPKKDGPE